jgi:hypothetical protein
MPEWTHSSDRHGLNYLIEQDWAGRRHTLAASAVAKLGALTTTPWTADDLATAFTAQQLRFLSECAGMPVNVTQLTPLGPIAVVKWEDISLGALSVNAERWRVDGLDFLELSIRVKDGAEGAQATFEHGLRDRGIEFFEEEETKTRTVLEHLGAVHGVKRG